MSLLSLLSVCVCVQIDAYCIAILTCCFTDYPKTVVSWQLLIKTNHLFFIKYEICAKRQIYPQNNGLKSVSTRNGIIRWACSKTKKAENMTIWLAEREGLQGTWEYGTDMVSVAEGKLPSITKNIYRHYIHLIDNGKMLRKNLLAFDSLGIIKVNITEHRCTTIMVNGILQINLSTFYYNHDSYKILFIWPGIQVQRDGSPNSRGICGRRWSLGTPLPYMAMGSGRCCQDQTISPSREAVPYHQECPLLQEMQAGKVYIY